MGFVDPAFVAGATDSHTCAICMQLLENPVIACDEGHTFCFGCLDDALKRDDRCPTCRAGEIVFVKCRALENSIAEMKMRCEHSAPAAAPAEEPAPKRRCAKVRRCSTAPASCAMMAPANGLGCEWRGRVSEYRAHLDVCVFKPRACTYAASWSPSATRFRTPRSAWLRARSTAATTSAREVKWRPTRSTRPASTR